MYKKPRISEPSRSKLFILDENYLGRTSTLFDQKCTAPMIKYINIF